jgi:hypothetical protein
VYRATTVPEPQPETVQSFTWKVKLGVAVDIQSMPTNPRITVPVVMVFAGIWHLVAKNVSVGEVAAAVNVSVVLDCGAQTMMLGTKLVASKAQVSLLQ